MKTKIKKYGKQNTKKSNETTKINFRHLTRE